MKFLLDLNIAASVASFLQRNHYDVSELRKKNLLKLPDKDVVELAKKEKRIILTHDKDFVRLTLQDFGFVCIVVRLKNQQPENVIKSLDQFLERREFKALKSGLVVFEEQGIRIYKT